MLSVAVFSDKPSVIMLSVIFFIAMLSLIFTATLNVVMLSIAFSLFYCYADHQKFLYAECLILNVMLITVIQSVRFLLLC
jgi:hypothetical protein